MLNKNNDDLRKTIRKQKTTIIILAVYAALSLVIQLYNLPAQSVFS
jgi:hypothetical protein